MAQVIHRVKEPPSRGFHQRAGVYYTTLRSLPVRIRSIGGTSRTEFAHDAIDTIFQTPAYVIQLAIFLIVSVTSQPATQKGYGTVAELSRNSQRELPISRCLLHHTVHPPPQSQPPGFFYSTNLPASGFALYKQIGVIAFSHLLPPSSCKVHSEWALIHLPP